MDLQSILNEVMSGNLSGAVSKKTGLKKQDVEQIIRSGIPIILGGLGKNVTTQQGADALNEAIDTDHTDTAILNDPDVATSETTVADGTKVLGHVFGQDDSTAVSNALSSKTGVDNATVMKILAMLAPVILAALAKQKSDTGTGGDELADSLKKQSTSDGNPLMDIVTQIIDKNKDGNMLDDVLGGLFAKN
jgi:hypothetical protein